MTAWAYPLDDLNPGFAGMLVAGRLDITAGLLQGSQKFCVGDINGNGSVGILDMLALLIAWGSSQGPADLDHDCAVDASDFLLLLEHWGPCP